MTSSKVLIPYRTVASHKSRHLKYIIASRKKYTVRSRFYHITKIKGHWLLAANKPEFDEKCKNLTFSIAENKKFILQEVLFMSKENWKRETNVYEVTKTPQAPFMLLENTASHYKVKLFLVDGDYSTYIIFYSCDDSSGTASDAWEIWTRGIRYESGTLPQPINRTLNKLKLKASDFSFTSASDCSH
ncbi:uncharacterized protein [Halyomorpha halys]|uniref:uncharacterized protein isoform X2 n=1 Tax=Halyomorpha halys TaxID=286706 RepID=UPI0006D50E3F|nr:uncharacterized protein LOC106689449 isoform X2 [Halyomorpha halys]